MLFIKPLQNNGKIKIFDIKRGVSPTIDVDANQLDQRNFARNFVFSKGYTIQGVPKNALSELPFVKPGLRVNGLPLPVGCFPGSARPCTLKPSFEKRQFRKCFSLGHPVERRYL